MPDTDSVYRTMQHILETYDGITSTDIDYNNMASNRGREFWKVGRQIEKRKKSTDYLNELCKHSFVSIYPTRSGKRGLKAWREDTTAVTTHDDSEIVKDNRGKPLISKFEKIPLSKVYNDIELNYDWNPGLKKFNKKIAITKTDQSTFPDLLVSTGTDAAIPQGTGANTFSVAAANVSDNKQGVLIIEFSQEPTWWENGQAISLDDGIGGIVYFGIADALSSIGGTWTGYAKFVNDYGLPDYTTITTGNMYNHGTKIPKWTTYVIGANDYVKSKSWWDICRNSYLETLVVNKLKYDCFWYYDNADFGEPGGTNNTAFYLLAEILSYCTKQKYLVEYYVRLNATNIQLELNDPVTFNDVNYTDGTDRLGYIKNIKIIPTKDNPIIFVSLILDPYTLESYNLIIETGSAPDTITESGSQPDTITEGAQ